MDGVSFVLHQGETLGVVGESGCGKSTLARAVLKLVPQTGGRVVWLGRDLDAATQSDLRALREDFQIVFQDPLASLDPRMPVGQSIAEPLKALEPGSFARKRTGESAQQHGARGARSVMDQPLSA